MTLDASLLDGHLAPELMARLLSGRVESEELSQLVLPHLLARCPECCAVRRELEALRLEVGHWDYVVAATEGADAPALWQRLELLPYAERLEAIDAEPALQTWGLCRLLLRLSEQAAQDQPVTAVQHANAALRVSEHLGEAYDPAWVCDLRALAHAHLGNARRRVGERLAAGDAFDSARRLRAAGTGYAAVEAEALELEALLRRDQYQLSEALALLDRAYQIYRGEGPAPDDPEAVEPHLAGRVRAHQAWCCYHSGQVERALPLLEDAEGLVERDREPRILLAAYHGHAWAATVLGRFGEAEKALRLAIELAEQHGDEGDRLRLRRVEARLDHAQGQRGPAEQALRQTSHELMKRGLYADAALAVLELADLYLKENAADGLLDLGNEIFSSFSTPLSGDEPTLSGDELPTPAIFTLLLFQEACQKQQLTPGMLRGFAGLLESLRRPSLVRWSSWGTVLGAELDRTRLLEPA
jgi:tetratricopeptide (TPR) repeat protein